MSRGMRLRRIAAIVLLAAVALYWLMALVSELFRGPSRMPYVGPAWVAPLEHGSSLLLLLVAAVGLARSWWWARLLTCSLAVAALAQVFINYLSFPSVRELSLVAGWAAALLVCLAGRRFRAHYEGRTAGLDWEAPGVGVLWWSIVLNGMTLVLLPLKLIGAWQFSSGCFGGRHYGIIDHQASAYWPTVLVAGLLLVGLVLLARRKTVGLLLTAVASVALPLVLVQTLRESANQFDARQLLLPVLPGLLAAWLALGFWARPLWRLLRS